MTEKATVELTVELSTTPVKAFRALSRSGQLRRWFVDNLDYDRSLLEFGAGRQLTFIDRDGPAGQGEVTVFRPARSLEFTWDRGTLSEVLRFDLTEIDTDADGADEPARTRLTFVNTISGPDAEEVQETADAVRPGWETALDRLVGLVDNSSTP